MIHKAKQILVLGAGLIALGAIATWDEWQTDKDEKVKETKGLLVTDVKPEDVTTIRYYSRGDSDVGGDKASPDSKDKAKTESKIVELTLVKKDGRWTLISPVEAAADNQAVSDLLKNILEYKSENEVANGKDKWTTFGIDPPRRKIDLETVAGNKLTFLVGNNTPVGFNAYVATSSSEKVFSGSQYITTATLKTLFEFRDKRVLPQLSAQEATTIFIQSGKEITKLEKVNNAWELVSPNKAKADTVAVNNLLDDLMALKALEIIDQPDSTVKSLVATGKSLGQLALQTPTSKISMRIIEGKNDVYATLDSQATVYKVNQDIKTKILKTDKDLRDKKIFSFQSGDIANVTVDGQSFRKAANDWYTEADAGKFSPDGKFTGKAGEQPSPASHIRGLVVDLEYARAEDIVEDQKKLRLPKAPKHQVVLVPTSGLAPIALDAWLGTGSDSEAIWLKISDSSRVYKVKKSVLAGLTPQAAKPPVGDEITNPTPEVSN